MQTVSVSHTHLEFTATPCFSFLLDSSMIIINCTPTSQLMDALKAEETQLESKPPSSESLASLVLKEQQRGMLLLMFTNKAHKSKISCSYATDQAISKMWSGAYVTAKERTYEHCFAALISS